MRSRAAVHSSGRSSQRTDPVAHARGAPGGKAETARVEPAPGREFLRHHAAEAVEEDGTAPEQRLPGGGRARPGDDGGGQAQQRRHAVGEAEAADAERSRSRRPGLEFLADLPVAAAEREDLHARVQRVQRPQERTVILRARSAGGKQQGELRGIELPFGAQTGGLVLGPIRKRRGAPSDRR